MVNAKSEEASWQVTSIFLVKNKDKPPLCTMVQVNP